MRTAPPASYAGVRRAMAIGTAVFSTVLLSQSALRAAEDNASTAGDDTIELSPFTVTTSKDNGYKATNSISGTRVDAAIKDIPMPIEVITDQFIKDTGATDLRQALRYSAGILLQTQNDQGSHGYFGPGGVNNPEGVTADPSQTYIKVRGFVTDTALRDGFRRQNSTDSVNVSRVEVVRGPAALLYGIGNFGGIVNYLAKSPEAKAGGEATLDIGTYEFRRATIDQTGPVTKDGSLLYRVTGAVQSRNDYTQYYNEKHYFVSPVLLYKPFSKTQVLLDIEYGQQWIKGMGFQQVRSVAGVGVNNDQNEHGGLFTVPGTDPKTFRWSGPDTYLNEQASNVEFKVTQEIAKGLNLLVGYNFSTFNYQQRDVIGSLAQSVGPAALQQTVTLFPVDPNTPDSNLQVRTGPVPNVILQYNWSKSWSEDHRDQERVELNYKLSLFEKNKWLKMTHSVLGGFSGERNSLANWGWGTKQNSSNYKSPTDASPIRYGTQGDGTPDVPMVAKTRTDTIAWDKAFYGVYQGRFLDERIMVLSGVRNDKNDLSSLYNDYENNNLNQYVRRAQQKERTTQNGVSVALLKGANSVSVYGLKSGGLEPNFNGYRDGYGNPIGATTAKSEEVGIKFDLFNGKLSATISKYKIRKEGTPLFFWWAPSPNGNPKFNPNKDIVYNVNNFLPTSVNGPGGNGGNGATDSAQTQWNAAVAAGAAYQKSGSWYVDASKAEGAAYLDQVFAFTQQHGDSWPGWLYNQDANTNNTTLDWAAGNGTYEIGTSESKGWDTQLLFSPTDNIQIVLNYAHTDVVIVNPGNFPKYPYPQDRWAVWYFPNTDWGLTNQPLKTMYTDPADTSTWTGYGYGAGTKADDTPKHHVDWFGIYRFTKGSLKGFSIGVGGYWESQREYLSGITHGAGQKITDKNGNPIIRQTPCRLDVDMMAKYEWKSGSGHDQSVQLNINNLLNDTKTYGLIYSAPLTARVEYAYKW